MAQVKRITERTTSPFQGAKVNREAGTIEGVLICGNESANGRDYPAEVFRRDFKAYEGRPVNCDHGRETTVDRRFGWFTDVTVGGDGRPRGTLNVLMTHPMADRVLEAANRNPALFGFSHVAMCETRTANGREIVEAIKQVESIDLVADPATTKGLFESRVTSMFTFKKLAEWVAKHPKSTTKQALKIKGLVEDLGDMGDMPAAPEEPVADADPDEAIGAGFEAAIMAIVKKVMAGEMDKKEGRKKIDKLFDGHADATGSDGSGVADSSEGDSGGEGDKKEGKKLSLSDIIAEAKAAGLRDLTDKDLAFLHDHCRTPEARKHYCESVLSKQTGEKPTSAGRNPGGGFGKPPMKEEKKKSDRISWDD